MTKIKFKFATVRLAQREEPFLLVDAQVLVGMIDRLATQMNGCYGELTPDAKVHALEVGHELSRLRNCLVAAISPRMPNKK